jgi:hypothetical protein
MHPIFVLGFFYSPVPALPYSHDPVERQPEAVQLGQIFGVGAAANKLCPESSEKHSFPQSILVNAHQSCFSNRIKIVTSHKSFSPVGMISCLFLAENMLCIW